MTTDPYPELDVTDWEVLEFEQMGSKPNKLWLLEQATTETAHGDRVKWLFKPRTTQKDPAGEFPKGDDWAEKVAGEIAQALQVPAATIEFARRGSVLGIVSGDVSVGRDLVLGNVVLFQCDPAYPKGERRGVPGYTVQAIYDALQQLGVQPPPGSPQEQDACSVFASYLVLDALVGNTDRHHENWGLLIDPTSKPMLAPTFDHASSLGFLLSDQQRSERLGTTDRNRTVEAYARRGRSRHFAGSPTLVALAAEAAQACSHPTVGDWFNRIEHSQDSFDAILDKVPHARMSQSSRMFTRRLLAENRRRLLDAFDPAR